MKLTSLERLALYNQYEILKLLNADDDYEVDRYSNCQEIVLKGYEFNYDTLIEGFNDEVSEDVSKFVYDVLQLYRSLIFSYSKLSKEEQEQIDIQDITYQGFDGNEETNFYTYSKFLMENMDLYAEIYNDGNYIANSHCSKISDYQEMIEIWKDVRERKYSNLTLKQIKQIIRK